VNSDRPNPLRDAILEQADLVAEERERRPWHRYEVRDTFAPSPDQRRVYNERNADRFAKASARRSIGKPQRTERSQGQR